MKSVLISIQPYYVFLIIAKIMGWDIGKEKTVEVRKNYPKDKSWNKIARIYCSKNKQSFNQIPKEYQPLMRQFLGKVIGEFVCDKVYYWKYNWDRGVMHIQDMSELSCVSVDDLLKYSNNAKNILYGWHISNLVIYEEPKELSEFYVWKKCNSCRETGYESTACCYDEDCKVPAVITRPPQSWCYVEGDEGK